MLENQLQSTCALITYLVQLLLELCEDPNLMLRVIIQERITIMQQNSIRGTLQRH